MATRSHVGYIDFDGKLKAAYCHWDGYPQGVLRNVLDFIDTFGIEEFVEETDRGNKEGGISEWRRGGAFTYGDWRDEVSDPNLCTVRDRCDLDNDYAYIFDRSEGHLVEAYKYGRQTNIERIIQESQEKF
ncbi:MAG TPA: hypothetical protein EYQ21_02685 [Flavobacteriales bacterium]|jgi:hypothetical protein|nr:hypothetical protein [Flavobacteriales bacterium]